MTKFLTVLAAASSLAVISVAVPTPADAYCRGCGVAAGVVGAVAAGAIIAGAASRSAYYDNGYAPGYAYEPAYAYGGPVYGGPVYGGPVYGGYGYGGSTADYTNQDRQLQGTR